ncbi:MAG TPA: hypothetical protein VFF40_12570 [Acidimicrobiia bacterium]|nr:hypothetical protein [Acidimicrobiia bacterium]
MAEKKVRTPLVVALGVVVLLVIGFFGYRLISSGGGSGDDSATEAAATPSTGADGSATGDGSSGSSTTTTTTPGEPFTPGQPFDAFVTKNPFQPVVVSSSAGTGTDATTPTTATTVPVNGGGTTPNVPDNQAPSAGTPVSLLEVFDDGGVVKARIQVGAEVYTQAAGETFATSYKVVSLDLGAQCGQFQFGDSPFQLCVGEQTLK